MRVLSKRVMRFLTYAAPASIVVAVLSVGCGAELTPPPSAPPAPPYTERDAQLFDDGVEARALGLEISGSSAKDDRLLSDRVEASDGVVRARVVTVTSKAEDSGTALQLSLHAVETVAGKHAPSGDFTLLASPRSPAAGLLGASEGRIVGMTFVVFVRGFAPANPAESDSVLHFHIARDDKDEQDKVRAAYSLGTLR